MIRHNQAAVCLALSSCFLPAHARADAEPQVEGSDLSELVGVSDSRDIVSIQIRGTHVVDLRDPEMKDAGTEHRAMFKFEVSDELLRGVTFLNGVEYVVLQPEVTLDSVSIRDIENSKIRSTGEIPCDPAAPKTRQICSLPDFARLDPEMKIKARFDGTALNLAPEGTVLGARWEVPGTDTVHYFAIEMGTMTDGIGVEGAVIDHYNLNVKILDLGAVEIQRK